MIKTVRPEKFDFHIAIEFPAPRLGMISGHNVSLWRMDLHPQPDIQIKSCEALSLHADAEGIMWAELLMWATPEGTPLYDGKPMIRDNQIITKVFNVHVIKVLSKASYHVGYTEGFINKHGKPTATGVTERDREPVEAT